MVKMTRVVQFILLLSTVCASIDVMSAENSIQEQIVSELHSLTFEGQDELLANYAAILEKVDAPRTVRVEYDPDKSQLVSYTRVSNEFSRKYRKSAVEERLIDELTELCNAPHNRTLRGAGISQKIVYLTGQGEEVFAGVEIVPDTGVDCANSKDSEYARSLCEIETMQEIHKPVNCTMPLDWKGKQHPYHEHSKQAKCEFQIQFDLEDKYDIRLWESRVTSYVQKARTLYSNEIEACKPKWKFWK